MRAEDIPRLGGPRLGAFSNFLLRRKVVTRAELDEAQQATVLFGGRLGTSLLELGLVTVDELEALLAAFHRIPAPNREWLERPDAAARAALAPDLVKRHSAFPLHLAKRTLHLALLDPRHEAILDDLSFASGCLISPCVISEYRFTRLLHRYYGVRPSMRILNLQQEADLARLRRGKAAPSPAAVEAAREPERDDVPLIPLADDLELSDAQSFVAQAAPPRPEPAAAVREEDFSLEDSDTRTALPEPAAEVHAEASRPAPPAARSLGELERRVTETGDRGEVIDLALEIAGRFVASASLFVVRGDVLSGMRARRDGATGEIESILLPLAAGSAFAVAVAEKKSMRLDVGGEMEKRLLKALGRAQAREAVAWPVAIGGRVVNLLIVDDGAEPIPQLGHAALAELCRVLSAAYERLIREKKNAA
jgi:hypothetical protein